MDKEVVETKTMKVNEAKNTLAESQDRKTEQGFTPGQKATARPWTWRSFGGGLLIANHRAHIVMDFVRKGMHGAEPRFGKRSDNMGGLMVPLSEWETLPPDAKFMIEAVNSYDALCALRDAAAILLTNAQMIADPSRGGATDCYSVPLDDVEALSAALSLVAVQNNEGE